MFVNSIKINSSSKNPLWDQTQKPTPISEETKPAKPTLPPKPISLPQQRTRIIQGACQISRANKENRQLQTIADSIARHHESQQNFSLYIEGDSKDSYAKIIKALLEVKNPGKKFEIIAHPLPPDVKFGETYQGKIVYSFFLEKCPTD